MDPVPDLDPTPDPTHIFKMTLRMLKKKKFLFFSYTYQQVQKVFSLNYIFFLLEFCVKILFCQALFQFAQDIYEKREASGSGRSKNMRIRFRIRIPNTGYNYKKFQIFLCIDMINKVTAGASQTAAF
jgi:hypothetical protein